MTSSDERMQRTEAFVRELRANEKAIAGGVQLAPGNYRDVRQDLLASGDVVASPAMFAESAWVRSLPCLPLDARGHRVAAYEVAVSLGRAERETCRRKAPPPGRAGARLMKEAA